MRIQSINIDTDLNCKEGIVGPFGASIGEHVPERLVLLGQINYLISFFFLGFGSVYVCMVITYSRVWINRVRLPILLVVS